MTLDVVDVHDEAVDDHRTVQPLGGGGAVLGVPPRALVRVVRVTHEHRRAVRAIENDVRHGAAGVGEALHLTEAECPADPLGRGAGIRVREHRDHARLAHRAGQ